MAGRSDSEYKARYEGLTGLVRLLMAQNSSSASSSNGRGGQGQIYVTDDAAVDESTTTGVRYPLHRLQRDETLQGIAARELERVRKVFPQTRHAGQIGGRARADAIDAAVTGAVRGAPAAGGGPDRPSLEAELKRLRTSPNSISDPVQKRIAEIKAALARMK